MKRIPFLSLLTINAALALAYYGAARLGLLLAFASTNVSPVWPPSGIGFAALLLLGRRYWPGILLGAFAANFVEFSVNATLDGVPALVTSFTIAVGNTMEALCGCWLLRRIAGPGPLLGEPRGIYVFVAVAAVMSLVGAALGLASLLVSGVVPWAAAYQLGMMWWLGDAAGILVVTPCFVAWSRRPAGWRWDARVAIVTVACLLVLALALYLLFGRHFDQTHSHRALVLLLLPTIGWACFRYGMRGVTLLLLLLNGAAVVGTTQGLGPFAAGTLNDALSSLEVFIALSSMVGMVLASDREAHLQRLGQASNGVRRATRLYLFHWSVLFVCLALTIVAWHYVASGTEQRARDLFEAKVEDIRRRVTERMDAYTQVLTSGKALFQASDSITYSEWRDYVSSLNVYRKYPGIQVLGVAERTTDPEQLARKMRAEGLAGYRVWPEGVRDSYVAVAYPEPLGASNARALGFDLQSEPVRRAALQRAAESGELATSGRVTLVQAGAAGRAGFLMFVPIFRAGAPVATPAERRQAVEHYVYAAFQMDDLMRGVFPTPVSKVALEIFDGRSTSPETRIYSNLEREDGPQAAYPHPYLGVVDVAVGDAWWTLRVTSRPEFEAYIDHDKALIVLVCGMMISLLFFSVVRSLTSNREEAIQHARATTSALRQSERKFGTLVESAIAFSIISTDLDGVIQVFSVGAERMLGYSADEMVGRQTPALIHVDGEVAQRAAALSLEVGRDVRGFAVFTELALMGRVESREWTYVRRDGSTLPVRLTVTAIKDEHGVVTGFLGIAKDITAQLQTEQDLRAAKQQADDASEAKSQFVANMSHELRTPLNAVLGLAELLSRTDMSAEQHRDLDLIRQSGHSLLGILNDILDFSKIEAGKMDLSPAPFELDALLAAVAVVMGVNAGGSGVEPVIDVAPGLPAVLLGDALRLQQVLVNLVGNAIKFTARGSVTLHVSGTVSADGVAALRFAVRDTGIGMSAEQLGRLFTAFTQADSSMTRRFGGTGLGLAISRRLVGMMGGEIAVDSREGEGSVFTVSLALQAVRAAAAPAPAAAAQLVQVVAANAAAGVALAHAAQRLGWQARTASEGELAALRGGGPAPGGPPADLVLLDWGACAGGDAAAMLRRLRTQSSTIVLVLASCHERARLEPELAALGAELCLDKPATAASLDAAVRGASRQRLQGMAVRCEPAQAALAPLAGRVLLVEDNELNQYIAKAMLAALGLTVEVAGNGQLALDLLRARPDDFALVLMDMQMPVMDGFAATSAIRQQLGLTLPVVAMTAGVMESERSRCVAAGMDDFIAKPVIPAQLRDVLARYLPGADSCADAAAQAEPSAPATVFDVSTLLSAMSAYPGHRQTMVQLVQAFVDGGSAGLDTARQQWQSGQGDAAARTLHGMRGSIGTLGALRFAAVCLELEQAIAQGDAPAAAGLFSAVAAQLQATLAAAQAWLAQPEAEPDAAPGPVSAAGLALLRQQLAEYNVAAVAQYESIHLGLLGELGEERAGALRGAMDRLDFDAALAALAPSAP
ncbi:CHASE domain-containing protein [Pseudoduganella aquatica]|uniref:CHASE domain-containing protein n=1 Tax=Pseudoduganella aquatica TaxID=2660641 RepID=UPI001E5A2AEC|nr:CHASE domain-containing protein [Pseudoduganella aquatica]